MIWLIKKLLLILQKWRALKEFLLRYEKEYTERYYSANSKTYRDMWQGALNAISNTIKYIEEMEENE